MTSRKVEISFVVLLAVIFAAAVLVSEMAGEFGRQLAVSGGVPNGDHIRFLYFAIEGLLITAAIVALVFVLPFLRAQSREHGKLSMLTSVLRRRTKEMEQAALTDGLTGLANRRHFDDALDQQLSAFDRSAEPLGLMILDLDHFKSINDTHGHDVGDEVLRKVSKCLMDYTRHHDTVARLGGEEFAVVVPNMSPRDLGDFADRLRLAVERLRIQSGNVRLRITMSIGLAEARPGENAASLYKRADINLYNAKQSGRNRICA
ncbi:MAG: GGDEF domain-containing protein [Hyphomicrobiales bacterium]|nr:MAG: GGDEF domain-containing protein [Hyphomicrobiales bacterium]